MLPPTFHASLMARETGATTCEVEVLLADGEKVVFSMVPREGAVHSTADIPAFLWRCVLAVAADVLACAAGVAAIENLLVSWSGASAKTEVDDGSGGSSDDDESEYMDSDSDDESQSSSDGSSSGGDGDSASSGSSSSDASDIDRAELEALLDESRDVLTESAAGGGGQLAKRARR